ncbi:hypothetical protein CC86DRAFT_24491 [Ophiobolus disseminans]|uniref:Uncharacterized protein n=1 Tax=Ophiobolus disseminans TaxID=1469910 RepID=A0A6A7A2W3_9PLEO|nr:hypothetical protein CC86DRAFT_24491 [Ophiobolus disseminans]
MSNDFVMCSCRCLTVEVPAVASLYSVVLLSQLFRCIALVIVPLYCSRNCSVVLLSQFRCRALGDSYTSYLSG